MKKNLLSILILALLIVNIVLTTIMMFSVISTNKKTGAVVTAIAKVLEIEVADKAEDTGEKTVSMEDTATYDIADEMTILLTKGEDGNTHYVLVKATISMDTTSEGYKSYGASISEKESLIKSEIQEVFGQYTADEIQPRNAEIQSKILERLNKMFDSDFIYKISFSELIVQ